MTRFARHFAADVARFTLATVAVATLCFLTLRGARSSSTLFDGGLAEFLSEVGSDLAGLLGASWTTLCAVGFAWATTHWMRRGQAEIVGSAGLRFSAVAWPGLLLALALAPLGARVFASLGPNEALGEVSWTAEREWGAAQRVADGWTWIEVAEDSAPPRVVAGHAASEAELPASARGALAASRAPAPGLGGLVGLLVVAVFALRVLPYRTGLAARFALGLPWLAWFTTAVGARLGAAFAESGSGAGWIGEGLGGVLLVGLAAAGEHWIVRTA